VKITYIETLRAGAGWKSYDFVKIGVDAGFVGWAELNREFGKVDVTPVLDDVASSLVGLDVESEPLERKLGEVAGSCWAGLQVAGAVSNALLDLRSKLAGVPVHTLLAGAVRRQIPLYWSHCGTYRATHAPLIGVEALQTSEDLVALGSEVARRGFSALKTNPIALSNGQPRRVKARPGETIDVRDVATVVGPALEVQLAALRAGAGDDVQLMLDIGSGYTVDAVLAVAAIIEPFDVAWLELEGIPAPVLRQIRERVGVPALVTGERLRFDDYRDYLDAGAADVMAVDVGLHGLERAVAIARVCQNHDVDVAPHNCYSPLLTMISAAFCALIPNLRILEFEVDAVAWNDDLVTVTPTVEDGHLVASSAPGWGTDVDEAAVRAHPP
jgi:L-alanine-DL-glutamate epimerase-like enolase superfamily enzyme